MSVFIALRPGWETFKYKIGSLLVSNLNLLLLLYLLWEASHSLGVGALSSTLLNQILIKWVKESIIVAMIISRPLCIKDYIDKIQH